RPDRRRSGAGGPRGDPGAPQLGNRGRPRHRRRPRWYLRRATGAVAVHWTEAMLAEADALQRQGATWTALAERYGVTRDAIRGAVRRWRQARAELVFPELKLPPGDSWDADLLDAMIAYQEKASELDTGQDEAT